MRKSDLVIPVMTLLPVLAILLNIPVFREIVVFTYFSFVPGFVLLKVFNLEKISRLNTFLFSVGLSIAALIFVGFLVNEIYIVLGLSNPLSVIPLVVAMSAFTLMVFFIGYRRSLLKNSFSLDEILREMRSHLPLFLVLVILPFFGIFGALYVNIPVMIVLSVIIAFLCVLRFVSSKHVPSSFFPLLILSISLTILCLNVLMSQHIIGDDSSVEVYVFQITQKRGYWGNIDNVVNDHNALDYNSMLSVTLLPQVYSSFMGLKGEIIFKILYPLLFSLVPLILFSIYEKYTGKIIGFISALFFVFTLNAFFGELTMVNRQIIATLFLLLSIYIWLDETFPTTKKRLLLAVFGTCIIVSHYSLAFLYLFFVALVVMITSLKNKFDDTFNTWLSLYLFGLAFVWYEFTSSGSVLTGFVRAIEISITELTNMDRLQSAGNVNTIYGLPQTFSVASWINLMVTGAATLFIIIGVFVVLLRSKRIGISNRFKLLIIFGASLLFVAFVLPSLASTINFTRFYAISFLFISPCFVIGGKALIGIINDFWMKISKTLKRSSNFWSMQNNMHSRMAFLLIAVLLTAYFLSQIGFVNYMTGGAIRWSTFDFHEMETSSDPRVQIRFYYTYTPEQDAFSAYWYSKYTNGSSIIYADLSSRMHVLISCALVPAMLIFPLADLAYPRQGSYIYLSSLNVAKGVATAYLADYFNTSEISFLQNETNLLYSNGNSQVWSVVG